MTDIELVQKDIKQCLAGLFRSAQRELVIASPYVRAFGVDSLLGSLGGRFGRSGSLYFLTDLSPRNVCQAATDPFALQTLTERIGRNTVRHLPRLHAKVYVADSAMAVVTSANLTRGGLVGNYEYGVKFSNASMVEQIREDVLAYGSLGSKIDQARLSAYCKAADEIRNLHSESQKGLSGKITRQLEGKIGALENDLIAYRLEGDAVHTVFERTILYLLKKHGPLKTAELHPLVSAIHPDLCDDSVDRVIEGYDRHFGKRWKHNVRTAQQNLKKRGLIRLGRGAWQQVASPEEGAEG